MPESYTEKDYSDRLVAFVDILGFQHLIKQDPQEALVSINIIDKHLQHVLDVLQKEYGKVFSIRLFSDCMCISANYTNDNLFYLIFELSFIQYYLSCEGIFLRGALSRGNHFENTRMIFSEGLVNAYEIEQKAIYPRIIIDDPLVRTIAADKDSYAPIYGYERTKDFVMRSPDGHYFVDYLQVIHQDVLDDIESLQRHKESIEAAVSSNLLDARVVDKYRWLADYHNYKVNATVCPDEYEEHYLSEMLGLTLINIAKAFPYFSKTL